MCSADVYVCVCVQALFGIFRAYYRLVGSVASRMLQETLGTAVIAAIHDTKAFVGVAAGAVALLAPIVITLRSAGRPATLVG